MANRVYVLRSGKISMPKRWIRVGGSDDYTEIPVLAYLIASDDRLILVDCGCSPVVTTDPDDAWGKLASLYHPLVGQDDLIDTQIRAAGFAVSDVTDVILTHLHMDHVGGLQLLDHPRVWLQRAEHRWGFSPDQHAAGGYYPREFELPDIDLHLLDGDSRIADGVQCIVTAGHTPGHQSVLIQSGSRLFCVVGDAVYNKQLLQRRSQPAVAWNVSDYMSSLGRLTTLESFFGATLLFSHDSEQAELLPSGTHFLD